MIKKTLSKVDRPAARALPVGYAGVLYDLANSPDTVWEIEPFRVGTVFYVAVAGLCGGVAHDCR